MTLIQFLNQHSFLVVGAIVLGVWALVLFARRRRARARAWLIWLTVAVLAVGAYFALRTAAPPTFESTAEVQRAISTGKPTLVEFYSDF